MAEDRTPVPATTTATGGTMVAMQGAAGDLYPFANIDDIDAHLAALAEREIPADVYEHDRDLLLDVRRVLERAG